MKNTESTTLAILAMIVGIAVVCLIGYALAKLVFWIIKQWKFINSRCVINHAGFKPLTFFRQFLVFCSITSCAAGFILIIDSVNVTHSVAIPSSNELIHGCIVFMAGILLLNLVFFWIKLKTNQGVAFYSVLLMVLVSFLFLLAIFAAFLSFIGKNQAANQADNASNAGANQDSRTIGNVVQRPGRVEIYDEKSNLIRTLNGVLDSFTPTQVNLRPNYSSNLVQSFDVNGNLKSSILG